MVSKKNQNQIFEVEKEKSIFLFFQHLNNFSQFEQIIQIASKGSLIGRKCSYFLDSNISDSHSILMQYSTYTSSTSIVHCWFFLKISPSLSSILALICTQYPICGFRIPGWFFIFFSQLSSKKMFLIAKLVTDGYRAQTETKTRLQTQKNGRNWNLENVGFWVHQ